MGIKCPKCKSDNPDTQRFCGECATPLPSSKEIPVTETLETPKEELTTGSTFAGRYQIIEELGKGGMGTVYRALDKELSEEVALKLIKSEIASDRKTIERFKNELRLARKIGHRNVGRMYELMEEEGKPFITMEFVEGEDLKNHVRREKRLSTDEAVSIAKQVCEGLSEAHELGVIHRDLKPQNIMIDDKGRAKIMDFGIARSVEAPGVTATGVIIGTPDYISPEQAEGGEADQRSDIYSLGVILYEMVTGSVPFKGDTALSVALKHKVQFPEEPGKLNPEVSEDLSRLILICMEKERERRYQNAEALLDDLKNIEEGLPLGTKIRPRRETFIAALIRKKLFIPALVVTLAIVGVIIWQLLLQKEGVPILSGKSSVAVLPFKDLSPQKDQEYLCDGLAETLINALTQIKDLKIPARTSAFFFKGKEVDIREIGKKLNVDKILEGSVQKADNRIRITAQLINVEDGYHLWSEQYERELDDVFVIQDEMSLAIVDSLKVKLLDREKAKLVKRYTENIEAYNLYLKGRFFWNKREREGLEKSIEYFQEAIEKDPTYALAFSGLADAYNILGDNLHVPPSEAFPSAKVAALKALELDNSLAEAHTSLAFILDNYEHDFEKAEKEYQLSIELKPAYATAHHWYAWHLAYLGRHEEALKEVLRARELDPLSPRINANVGQLFYFARKYDRAFEELKKSIELFPEHLVNYHITGQVYAKMGRYGEAISSYEHLYELAGVRGDLDTRLAYIYSLSGKRGEAQKNLNNIIEYSKQNFVPPISIARVYVGLGEKEQAFFWLEKGYSQNDARLIYLKIDPTFDPLRSDPRYTQLLRKIGLEK